MYRVQKYLKPFYIGDLVDEEIETIDEDQAIKDDFAKLRQKAIAKVNECCPEMSIHAFFLSRIYFNQVLLSSFSRVFISFSLNLRPILLSFVLERVGYRISSHWHAMSYAR